MYRGKVFIISAVLVATFSAPAYAYLDPGTGSMLLQALIGGIAAGATVISIYWQKIKIFMNEHFAKTGKKNSENDQSK